MTGNSESAALYDQAAALRLVAMESLLWDAERGAWFDYNLVTHTKHSDFYPSNLAPLWAQCYSKPEMGEKAVQYLKVSGYSSPSGNNYFVFIKMAFFLLPHIKGVINVCRYFIGAFWVNKPLIQWPRVELQLKTNANRKRHSKLLKVCDEM